MEIPIPGACRINDIFIEFEIGPKFAVLWFLIIFYLSQ